MYFLLSFLNCFWSDTTLGKSSACFWRNCYFHGIVFVYLDLESEFLPLGTACLIWFEEVVVSFSLLLFFLFVPGYFFPGGCEHSIVSNISKSLIIRCHLHHSSVLIFLLLNKRNLTEGTIIFNVIFACSICLNTNLQFSL